MTKVFFVFILIFTLQANSSYSQSLSLNTDGSAADPSAILDVKSTLKGMLIPRVTLAEKNAINLPANGLMVYQTDINPGFYFYDGIAWKSLTASSNNSGLQQNSGKLKSGVMIVVYTDLEAYGFSANSAGNPNWYSFTLSSPVIGSVATDSAILLYTATDAYGFAHNSLSNPNWYSQSLSGTPVAVTGSGNRIVVSTTTDLYGFSKNSSGNPNWYSQSLTDNPIGVIANDKDCIIIYTASDAYGFNANSSGNPNWYSQSLADPPISSSATGRLMMIYTATTAYGFGKNSAGNPNWYSQSLLGTPQGILPGQE
jgi:hypothetical protein